MIPVGVIVKERQPEIYEVLRMEYRLPEYRPQDEEEFTPIQRMIDRIIRHIPKGAMLI